jgi:hypothetical protein
MNISITLNGSPRTAELDVEDVSLVLTLHAVAEPLEVRVDRREVRAALAVLGVDADRNMWWDGYNEALADVERAVAAGKGDACSSGSTTSRQKFGLQLEQ